MFHFKWQQHTCKIYVEENWRRKINCCCFARKISKKINGSAYTAKDMSASSST
jgi:hypothetical protein